MQWADTEKNMINNNAQKYHSYIQHLTTWADKMAERERQWDGKVKVHVLIILILMVACLTIDEPLFRCFFEQTIWGQLSDVPWKCTLTECSFSERNHTFPSSCTCRISLIYLRIDNCCSYINVCLWMVEQPRRAELKALKEMDYC